MFEFSEIPLYRGYLGIIISDSKDKIKEIIPDFESDEIYAHTYYHNYNDRQAFTIILNLNSNSRYIYNGTISHESLHVCNMILDNRGIIPSFENDEASAYLVEWIVDKIYEFISKNKLNDKIH